MLYLPDTCIYGVLVDKKHREYENVRRILDYAKKHREDFITTFIVFKELDRMDKASKSIILPEYYSSFSRNMSVIESAFSERYTDVLKLAWKYIQKLKKKNAKDVLDDALNYAWTCHAGVDVFVTLNRRDILAKEFQPIIKRINEEMRVKYVKVMTPTEFLRFLNL